jgi:hypothetical protein
VHGSVPPRSVFCILTWVSKPLLNCPSMPPCCGATEATTRKGTVLVDAELLKASLYEEKQVTV